MRQKYFQERPSAFARLYDRIFLSHPWVTVAAVLAIVVFFTVFLKDFTIDASSDSIVLENDLDLQYYSYTRDVFGSDDYVFLTLTPKEDLFSEPVLNEMGEMAAKFEALDNIKSVTSILSVPLFHSPNIPLLQLAQGYKTLSRDADRELARREILESPLYRDLLISEDGRSTNLQINFADAPGVANEHYQTRERLRLKKMETRLTAEEQAELTAAAKAYDAYRKEAMVERKKTIDAIRGIMIEHRALGELYLGGVPMIMVDIISYVRDDILTFGVGIVLLIMVMLAIIFRKVKWVLLTAATCVFTVFIMVGYLGFTDWWTTIVTSNFTSLLLIMTLAMAIHIVVRFREIYAGHPDGDSREMVLETLRHMAVPCLYMALTTSVGFGSLIVSGIRPVMDFGIMMTMGLAVAYFMCFVFFPAGLLLFPLGKPPAAKFANLEKSPMAFTAYIAEHYGKTVAVAGGVLFVVCLFGASRLTVENRFIDYFKEDTPIYQGMTIIDERLGGTTPLEIVIDGDESNYWLEPENLLKVREVHQWLEALPETGKVISPDTFVRILEKINNGNPVPRPMLALAINSIPEELREEVLKPYVNDDFSEVRIAMRVMESSHDLNRKDLLQRIDAYFVSDESPFPPERAHVTGLFVLYNNLLQSLWKSQILTIGAVFGAVWVMFLVLFRSFKLATIAIIPNILPVVLVLGTLGWIGVPLDIMTIMIAAITLGIAVDDTVHYIHRFREEYPKDRSYVAAMYRCHNSIGRAMWYTSLCIIAGFSILTLSNFIPNIYFGFFTGIAMIVALAGAIIVLPLLLITWKPFGPDAMAVAESEDIAAAA